MKTAEEWILWWVEQCQSGHADVGPLDVFRAIQADALEAAAEAAREFLTGMTSKEVTRAIVELIPTAPGTPRPGEPSSSPGPRTPGK